MPADAKARKLCSPAMPDDISSYLLLDECVLARCRSSRPKGWNLSDPSKWVMQTLIFVGDVVYAPAVTSTPRFLLRGVVATLVFVIAGITWYWASTARFIESTDDAYVGGEITTLSAKVAGFIQTVTVVDNQAVKAGDLLLKLGGSRLPRSAHPCRGERRSATGGSRQYRGQPAHAPRRDRTGISRPSPAPPPNWPAPNTTSIATGP